MKIMLVIPHVSDGGGEKVFSELACNLSGEIVVVVFEEKFSYPIKGKVISLNAPIDRASPASRALGFVRRILRFRRTLRQQRPDVVLSFMGEANFINALLSHRPVLSVHTYLSAIARTRKSFEAFVVSRLTRWLYRRAVVVAVSEEVKRDLVEEFRVPPHRVVVIPNAVDIAKVERLAREPADCPWNNEQPVVITAGRLTEVKGQSYLIRAFAAVRKTRSCQLVVMGAGELEDSLKKLVADLRIQTDVFFLGWQPNPFKFMAKADIFVLPSITEAFGLALVEAMVCGLPVIASDCPGGSRELVMGGADGPSGVLVPAADERSLADELVRMLDDRKERERYIKAGRARGRAYDISIFVEKYQRLLETVGGHRPPLQ
jgi:glycosyltransferase involved in cell wall biosynthesis